MIRNTLRVLAAGRRAEKCRTWGARVHTGPAAACRRGDTCGAQRHLARVTRHKLDVPSVSADLHLLSPGSAFTKRGSAAPVQASVWAMKLAACCCTMRYRAVCSGRWRSWWSGRQWVGRAAPDTARAGRRRAIDTVGVRHSPRPHSIARIAGPTPPCGSLRWGIPMEGAPSPRMDAFVHRP